MHYIAICTLYVYEKAVIVSVIVTDVMQEVFMSVMVIILISSFMYCM